MNATNLCRELLSWADGNLNQTAPTQLSDSEHYYLLADAIDFELGNYTCSESEQRRKAKAAIRRFCAAAKEYE